MFLPSKVSAAGLAVLLGSTSGIWLAAAIISPHIAQPYTARVNVAIDRQGDESYEALLRRAELVARAAAQRSFDRDILINDVSIMIIAQSQGSEVPILTLDVSRQQWRGRPDARRWATYYKTAKTLLGLDNATAPGTFLPNRSPQSTPQVAPRPISLPRSPAPPAPTPQTPLPPSTTTPGRSPTTSPSGQPSPSPSVRPGTINPPRTTTPRPSPTVAPEDDEDQ